MSFGGATAVIAPNGNVAKDVFQPETVAAKPKDDFEVGYFPNVLKKPWRDDFIPDVRWRSCVREFGDDLPLSWSDGVGFDSHVCHGKWCKRQVPVPVIVSPSTS